MRAYIITITAAFFSALSMTISTTFVQALDQSIPDFELNVFRSLGPIIMVLPLVIKVRRTLKFTEILESMGCEYLFKSVSKISGLIR